MKVITTTKPPVPPPIQKTVDIPLWSERGTAPKDTAKD